MSKAAWINQASTMYRGSVKNLLGPATDPDTQEQVLCFDYTDAYSVFDWGRMPDKLESKGAALALMAAWSFEALENPASWKEFSKSQTALKIRRANPSGIAFMECGEDLQKQGLKTHYRGVVAEGVVTRLSDLAADQKISSKIVVKSVEIQRPSAHAVLGQLIWEYPAPIKKARLVPLEVVFRYSVPKGSSLLERAPGLGLKIEPGHQFEFPYLECFSKLETKDRFLPLGEALLISGLSVEKFAQLLHKTAWVSGFLREAFLKHGLELADGKLEWGVDELGELILVDAIGPDELRILARDASGVTVHLSKEFLRNHYRKSDWYTSLGKAKERAQAQGLPDWKKLVVVEPQLLPPDLKRLAESVYLSMATALSGRSVSGTSLSIREVISKLGAML